MSKHEDSPDRLRVTEIFVSLQGEADAAGWPTVFVRLTGCPLRCGYCDTTYAFQGGTWLTLDDILAQVAEAGSLSDLGDSDRSPTGAVDHSQVRQAAGVERVCVTGGEPLAQKACPRLLTRLCDAGYRVSLETSGALSVAGLDPRVVKVVDIKTPGSGEAERNHWCNLEHLSPQDQLKFVIVDRADYEWARGQVLERELAEICTVFFSPAAGTLAPRQLAEWILEDRLPVRFQLQLHKILWGDTPGH